MKPGAILATNTSTLDVEQDRRVHQAAAGRGRHALLQPGQRDEAARGGARREDRQGRARHRDGAGKKIKKTAVVSGVCDGFIGNRMIEQYSRQARLPAGRGRDAAAGRQGDREVRLRDGPVPHGRPGRQRHRLGTSASAATSRSPNMRYSQIADLLCELGRFGQKTGAGWYDYEAGKRDAIPIPVVDEMIDEHRKELGHHAAQDRRRGDRRAPGLRAGQRRRADPRGRHRAARLRHRHGLPHRLRLPAAPRRPDALRRHGGPVQRGAGA